MPATCCRSHPTHRTRCRPERLDSRSRCISCPTAARAAEMERYVSGFLRSSLTWLVIGTSIGASMAIEPRFIRYRPAHVHALLLGFVMMMIAGVAYHVIPRFTMAALHSPRLARLHLVVANLGLLLMVCG